MKHIYTLYPVYNKKAFANKGLRGDSFYVNTRKCINLDNEYPYILDLFNKPDGLYRVNQNGMFRLVYKVKKWLFVSCVSQYDIVGLPRRFMVLNYSEAWSSLC
jgi:hypothetical protein